MRAFIAIVPPAPVLRHLLTLETGIRSIAPGLRCEAAEKLHFTLEFLGDKDPSWLEACRDASAAIAAAAAPFEVTLRSIGFFPAKTAPRIIWAGSQPDENIPLCSFAGSVRIACMRLGHAGDGKHFHPHITLARVKQELSHAAVDRIAELMVEPPAFTCTEVCVMQSILHGHGSEYRRLYTLPLLSE